MNEEKTKIYEFNFTQHLTEILVEFDFDRVYTTMKKLNWSWASINDWEGGIPSTRDIKRTAVRLLNSAYNSALRNTDKYASTATGGLKVTVDIPKDYVQLEFVVTEWCSVGTLGQ